MDSRYIIDGSVDAWPLGQPQGIMDADVRPEDQDMVDSFLNCVPSEVTQLAPLHLDDAGPTSVDSTCSSLCATFGAMNTCTSSLPLLPLQPPSPASHVVRAPYRPFLPEMHQPDLRAWAYPAATHIHGAATVGAQHAHGMLPWPRQPDTGDVPVVQRPTSAAVHHYQEQQQQQPQYLLFNNMMPYAQGGPSLPPPPPPQQQQQQLADSMPGAWPPAGATAAQAAMFGDSLPVLDVNWALDDLHNPPMRADAAADLFGPSSTTTTTSSMSGHALSTHDVAELWRTSLPPAVDSSTAWPASLSMAPTPSSASDSACPAKPWKWDLGIAPVASCPNLHLGFKDFIATRDVRMPNSATSGSPRGVPPPNLFSPHRDASASAFRPPPPAVQARPPQAGQGRKRSSDFLSESVGPGCRGLAGQAAHVSSVALHAADMAGVGVVAMVLPCNGMQPQASTNQTPPSGAAAGSLLAGHLFPAAGQQHGGRPLPASASASSNNTHLALSSRLYGELPGLEARSAGQAAPAMQPMGPTYSEMGTTAGHMLPMDAPAPSTHHHTAAPRQQQQRQSLGQLIPALALQASQQSAAAAAAAAMLATQQAAAPPLSPAAGAAPAVQSSARWVPTDAAAHSSGRQLQAPTATGGPLPSCWVPPNVSQPVSGSRQSYELPVPRFSPRQSLDQSAPTTSAAAAARSGGKVPGGGHPAVLPPPSTGAVVAGPEWMTFFSQCSASLTAAAAALQLAGDDHQVPASGSTTSGAAVNDLPAVEEEATPSFSARQGPSEQRHRANDAAATAAHVPAQSVVSASVRGGGGGPSSGLSKAALTRREALLPSLDTLRKVFELPLKEAAGRLGVSVSHMKNMCRRLGVRAWPHRKLGSLHSLRQAVLDNDEISDDERKEVVGQIDRTRAAVLADPDFAIPPHLDLKRKAVYKQRHAICKQQLMGQEQSDEAM